jgi:hypothetical protein
MAYFKVLSHHFPGGIKDNHKSKFQAGQLTASSNYGPPKYEAGLLIN